ncbi:hypothetical protein FOB32_17180 [Burkholderia multivorans]|nr:hypothetical protein FOB32_17180 [Burkholderia multivorans]
MVTKANEFKVGDAVRITKKYEGARELIWSPLMDKYIGREGVVTVASDGRYRSIRVAVDGDEWWYLPESLEHISADHPFKAGDKLRITYDGFKPADVWGKGLVVECIEYKGARFVRVRAHNGTVGLIERSRLEKVEEQPEPVAEFRIRKHGTTLRELRGTSYATQEEAEQAVSRYTPGSVYEIVEVKVVRTVKVEQEVRVTDYKEAA